MHVAVVGSGGMLGHVVYLMLKQSGIDVVGYSKSAARTVDVVVPPDQAKNIMADVIVNCAGILNQAAEDDPTAALDTNTTLPRKLACNCKLLIHISTDCVFDGKADWKTPTDPTNAVSMYGRTKALGEIACRPNVITLRQSVIGPSLKKTGAGLLHWALTQTSPTIPGYVGHSWNGVTTLELAGLIMRILHGYQKQQRIHGLFHYVTHQPIQKADLLEEIGRIWGCGWTVERTVTSPVLRCLALDPRIKPPPPIVQQMVALHDWMKTHSDLYSHYDRSPSCS